MDIRQALLMLTGRPRDEETSIGEFAGEDYRRRNPDDINRRAMYETRSALRQLVEPVPQAPEATAPPLAGRRTRGQRSALTLSEANVTGIPSGPDQGMDYPQAGPVLSGARDIIPNAPQGSQAEQENAAWRDAHSRARQAISQEGYPYFRSPSVVRAGDAMAAAVDTNRAARQEQARREGVSWDNWWHFRGRQDADAPLVAPFDFGSAYRTEPAPYDRYSARQRNPGPR